MTTHAPVRNGLTGWHVLAFMGAFFGVVFAVSATFLWFAVATFPGDDPAAYRRGLHYNRTLAEEARQDRLGWRVTGSYEGDGQRLVVSLRDAAGRPLAGERVVAVVGRPATSRFDKTAALTEESAGRYVAPLRLDPGSWDVKVRINADGSGIPFNESLRLWIEQKP